MLFFSLCPPGCAEATLQITVPKDKKKSLKINATESGRPDSLDRAEGAGERGDSSS